MSHVIYNKITLIVLNLSMVIRLPNKKPLLLTGLPAQIISNKCKNNSKIVFKTLIKYVRGYSIVFECYRTQYMSLI